MLRTCKNSYCKNKAAKGRNYCYRCTKRKWAKKNSLKYAYNNLKSNAKRRNKPFDLTFDEFKRFAIKTNYMYGKGKTKNSLTIDRIDEDGGYTLKNIQVLENEKNIQKYLEWKYDEESRKMKFVTIISKVTNRDENQTPF